jgi:hypothetical protein
VSEGLRSPDLERAPLVEDPEPADPLLVRVWRVAYVLLAATSDTDLAGKSWMAAGLGFVLVVWFVFRRLAETAALSRAIAVGDTARLFELTDRHVPRARAGGRARLLIARAFAHQLRGEFAEALAVLDQARGASSSAGDLEALARVVELGALIELGRPAAPAPAAVASTAGRADPAFALAWLADAQRAWAAGKRDTAGPLLARIIDDIRAGNALRAIAHVYAARLADGRGDRAAAARHRTAAAAHAAPDAAWLRSGDAQAR